MTVAKSKISCGVRELTGLSQPSKTLIQQVMKAKGKTAMYEDFIHVMFSDNVETSEFRKTSSGIRLAKLIEKEKLGNLMVTSPRVNPNSGNHIQTWIWSVNWKRVKDFTK